MGRGVVVTTHCGSGPSRSANCSVSQARSGRRHLHSSSHQAASNWGPRRLSGSSAANICAIVPLGQTQLVPGDLELRALGRRVDRQQAGQALDHHAAHLADGLADEGDAARALPADAAAPSGARAHPLGAGARLAGAAAAEHEPGAPGRAGLGRGRGQLIVARPAFPGVGEPRDLVVLERAQRGGAHVIGQAG